MRIAHCSCDVGCFVRIRMETDIDACLILLVIPLGTGLFVHTRTGNLHSMLGCLLVRTS